MLVIYIALGIVLAVGIFAFLPLVVAVVGYALILVLAVCVAIWVILSAPTFLQESLEAIRESAAFLVAACFLGVCYKFNRKPSYIWSLKKAIKQRKIVGYDVSSLEEELRVVKASYKNGGAQAAGSLKKTAIGRIRARLMYWGNLYGKREDERRKSLGYDKDSKN